MTHLLRLEYGKVENSNFATENPGRHHLDQMTQIDITNDKLYWRQVPKAPHPSLSKNHNPSQVVKKYQSITI